MTDRSRSIARDDLPTAVHDLAVRLGVRPEESARTVRLTQTGRMKRDLEALYWMPFSATQTISTQACAFEWRARAGPLGAISANNALKDGSARFDILALGLIPIACAEHSAALVRGELMRYLAEIPWAPDAILRNPDLSWRPHERDILVSAGSGDTAAEVRLSLDGNGRIAGAFAPDRPRSASPPTLPTAWRGRFWDYRYHAGRWLPFTAEVAWDIDGTERIYWQGNIATWETRSLSSAD